MKLMKIMPTALLLCLSLGVYAQDEDLSEDAVAEDEATEFFVPSTPTEKKFFQRVQVGFVGTNAKYTNNNAEHQARVPVREEYFLKGASLGWMGDVRIAKKMPLYLELGAMFTYRTGRSKGDSIYRYHCEPGDVGDGEYTKRHYRIQAFSVTIPVSVSYQFRNVFGVDKLTIAPFAGLYFRFNAVCNRWETKTTTVYSDGEPIGEPTVSRENRSLMKDRLKNDDGWMEGRKHRGKLLQPGVQIGANAFYKNFSFGLSYMYDLIPFASHSSPEGITTKDKSVGGVTVMSGTGCDMEISTRHNFAVTVGYVF